MKKLLLSLLLVSAALLTARAHDHIEVGVDPGNPTRLAFDGNTSQLATYFPLGEAPSSYLYAFPGGAFASELTFSVEGNVLAQPNPAFVRVEMLAVSGPTGGAFSFWEDGAATPTWTQPAGWAASGGNQPSLAASEDGTGYGHIHGRAFSMSQAGVYDVTFRAVDTTGNYTASAPFVVRFTAILPPQLAISKLGASIKLTFTGRPDLIYDVQSSTTLNANDWTTIGDPLDGTGGILEFTDPIGGRPRAFYRLVEYQ